MRPLAFLLLALAAGCGGSRPPISAPSYDPAGMAKAALAKYDANKNGALDGAELDACPAVKGALAGIDANKDRKVSEDELAARFAAYAKSGVGAVGVSCVVNLNGKPLAGAEVKFVPESCMLGAVGGGTGTTGADGIAAVAADGTGVPGLGCGLYKITVTRGADIPARYNTETTLGREVFSDPRGAGGPIELNLTK